MNFGYMLLYYTPCHCQFCCIIFKNFINCINCDVCVLYVTGMAVEDVLSAQLVYNKYQKQHNSH